MAVSLCVCLFPNSSETVNTNEKKFWGMIPLRVQMVLGLKISRYGQPFSGKLGMQWSDLADILISQVLLGLMPLKISTAISISYSSKTLNHPFDSEVINMLFSEH